MGRCTIKLVLTVIFSAVMAVGCGGGDAEGAKGSKDATENQRPIGVSNNSLHIIVADNASEYPVSGTCDFDSKYPVVVSVEGLATPASLDCQSDNTFSGVVDMNSVTSSPAVVNISQDTSSASLEIRNELVPLTVLDLKRLPSSAEGAPVHGLTGQCDGSDASGSLPEVIIGIASLGISESVPCTLDISKSIVNGTFSFEFPMGTSNPRALAIQLTQGSWKMSMAHSFSEHVVDLALDDLEILNLSTAESYVVSGKCDSSLEGQSLRIHIEESGGDVIDAMVPKQALCVKDGDRKNTFFVSFNLVNLKEPSIVFHASYGRKNVKSSLSNNIVSLSFAGFAPIVRRNISNYLVRGVCDSSLSEQSIRVFVKSLEEEIASEEVSCDSTLGVGFNTFSAPFDLRDMPGSSVTFHAIYGGENIESSPVEDKVVPLSFNSTILLPLNLARASAYEISGRCDSSVNAPVKVALKNLPDVISKLSHCSIVDNTFSLSFDLRTVSASEIIFELSHGSESVESFALENRIVNLVLDLSTLVGITSDNAVNYTFSGNCDPSLFPQKVQVTMGSPDITKSIGCLADSTFVITINVSELISRPSAAIAVVYGDQEQTATVSNDLIQLALTGNPGPLNGGNQSAYTLAGVCNSASSAQVILTVLETRASSSVNCTNNQFSVSVDASNTNGNFIPMILSHGSQSLNVNVPNQVILLSLDTPLTPFNLAGAENYTLTGNCDPTVSDLVWVNFVDEGSANSIRGPSACTAGAYSVTLDGRVITSNPVLIQATHGTYAANTQVVNSIVRLAMDPLPSDFNLATALAYSISGDCDFSLNGAVTITFVGTSVSGSPLSATASCVGSNTFSVTLDASAVIANSFTVQASYEGVTEASASVTNRIVRLSLDPLPSTFNLATAADYSISGACDVSLAAAVTITLVGTSVGGNPLNGSVLCANDNTFSLTLDASVVTAGSFIVQADYGSETQSSASVTNRIVRLSLDPLPSTFNLATAADYSISGACDVSLAGEVAISLVGTSVGGSPLGATVSCVGSNTFSVTLDASAVTASDFMVQASYEGVTQTSASVSNNIVRLSLTQPTATFNASTALAYPLSGECDSSVATNGSVLISLQGTNISRSVNCSNNSFDSTLNASSVKDLESYPSTLIFEASYGGETSTAAAVDNNYILLSLNALGTLNSATAGAYVVSGDCDDSLGELVIVGVLETQITENAVCQANSFTQVLDLNALNSSGHPTVIIQVAHDGQIEIQSVSNSIVFLAFSGTQEPLINANRDAYTISGACDNSLGDVTVDVDSSTVTSTVTCESTTNTFTRDLDLAGITSDPMQISLTQQGGTAVTQSVANNTTSNDATLSALSLSDGAELSPAFGSETLSYTANTALENLTVTATLNHEGATLVSIPAGTQSDTVATILFPLDSLGDHTLTLTVTAEDGVTEKIYTVTVTRVTKVQLDTSLEALTNANKDSYTVTGTCDSSVLGNVVVVMGDPATVPQEVPCQTEGIFSASVDASGIVTNPVTISVAHGDEVVSRQVNNEMVGSLYFSAAPPLITDVAYPLSGTCVIGGGNVTVVIGEPDATATITCGADGTFSGTLDVQAVSSHPAKVSLSQGGDPIETRVSNDIQLFVTVWEFPSDYEFTIPLVENYDYNFTVDWGDSSSTSEVTSFSDSDKVHTYTEAGQYTVTIKGVCQRFYNVREDKDKLLKVLNLGNMGWKFFRSAFYKNTNLTTVLGGNTSNATSMFRMFFNALSATPDTSGWDTSKVTDMNNMFDGATSATPDTSGWDTSKVTDMNNMFDGATSATPDTSGWDTSKVTDMNNMFGNATSATPDTSGWVTSSVTSMRLMFNHATSATPDTSGWDTSEVLNMEAMFFRATSADPDTSGWNTSSVTNMGSMFYDATSADPDTSGWDTSSVTNMYYMFSGATSADPDTSGWNTSSVTRMYYMFSGATSADPDTSGWDTSSVTDMDRMFSEATSANPDTSGWNTSSVTDMDRMFSEATSANPDTSGWNTSSVTDMGDMFYYASSADPDTSGWITSSVTDMNAMFSGATSANPDTSGWDTSSVTDMSAMFSGATSADPDTSGWNTSSVTDMDYMFKGATSADPDTSGWDTSSVTSMSYMFFRATSADPNTSFWNFTNVTVIRYIFSSATNLSVANYSKFLVSLNANPPSSILRKVINVGSLQYNSTATSAHAALVTAGWTITDGDLVTK